MEQPHFRFSGRVGSIEEYKKHLMGWFEHFKNLGIPCAIVFDKAQGNQNYSLWRVGVEHSSSNEQGREPNSEVFQGVVVKECLDFSSLIKDHAA